jgi:hypothetical protein
VPRAAALAANFVEAERKSRSETALFGGVLFMASSRTSWQTAGAGERLRVKTTDLH